MTQPKHTPLVELLSDMRACKDAVNWEGTCQRFPKWGDMQISGDTSVSIEIQANFGCRLWTPEEPETDKKSPTS